jgi:hypothetical protein
VRTLHLQCPRWFQQTGGGYLGKNTISAWTPENEANDARDLAGGKLKACYVILSRQACGCCNDTPFNKRSDYDTKLDLNLNGAVPCKAK